MEQSTTSKPIWKKWWFWLAVVVVLGVIGQLSGGGNGSTSSASAGSATEKKEVATPDLEVTAEAYYADYDANEVAADASYKGKLIQITGTVSGVRKTFGSVYVDLETSNPYLQVYCQLKDEADAASISKGSRISLVGTGGGKPLVPTVDDCVIVK